MRCNTTNTSAPGALSFSIARSATRTRPGGRAGFLSSMSLPSACKVPFISMVFALIGLLRCGSNLFAALYTDRKKGDAVLRPVFLAVKLPIRSTIAPYGHQRYNQAYEAHRLR